MFEFVIAIILVGLTAVFVLWFLDYKSGSSRRRMMQMMQRAGLNPAIVDLDDTASTIRNIRHQCRKCQSEDLCERWLAGEEEGDNAFCPNAEVFEELKQVGHA